MNQSELISIVAADTDLSTAGAARAVAAVVSAIAQETLNPVRLTGARRRVG